MQFRITSCAAGALLAAGALVPSHTHAQLAARTAIEPQAGVWFLTGSSDGISNTPAPYFGVRLTRLAGERWSLTAGAAYLWTENAQTVRTQTVSGAIRTDVYGVTYLPVSVGGAYALAQGPTTILVGLEGGVVKMREPLLRSDGPPPFAGFPATWEETAPLLVPSVSVGRGLTDRLSLRADARMLLGGASAGGVPMLGLGVGWRLAP